MNILFDYRMKDWSGIGRYSSNLVDNLNNISINNKLFLLSNSQKTNETNFKNIICNSDVFSISEQLELPILNSKGKFDLFHSPHFVFPIFNFKKLVLTIHDLTPLLFPEYFSKIARLYMKWMIWLAKFKANKIIAVSENTKQDLINKFGIDKGKIAVVYNGVDVSYEIINNQTRLSQVKEKYETGQEYILYVGNVKPHKNISRLLKAFSMVNRNSKLIIVGKRNKVYDEVHKIIKEYQLKDKVVFTEFVPDEDLLLLYNAATVFVYPSLYEGFGLPPLEAMACGTPVITSNVSSLPEVVGDAAITIDPYDIDELVNEINNVISNPKLQQKLSRKGLNRAKKFTWRKAAEETLKVYEEVLQE